MDEPTEGSSYSLLSKCSKSHQAPVCAGVPESARQIKEYKEEVGKNYPQTVIQLRYHIAELFGKGCWFSVICI